MKTLLRFVLFLALTVWLGAEFFFPFLAATVFGILRPDTHTAGRIVGSLLTGLHDTGLIAAIILLLALAVAFYKGIYRAHHVALMMGLVLLMTALTLHSQYTITPAMESDRIAAGGDVHAAPIDNPARIDFERLHQRSERVEGVLMLFGLLCLYCLARAEDVSKESEA